MSAKPNVEQEPRLISREYTWSNISFVRQWKKYRREWSKCVSVLVLVLFCFGELKRVLWARQGNDSLHLTFFSCCKSASVLRNLLPNYPHLGLVLEMWDSGVKVAVNPCCTFGSPTDQSTSRLTLIFLPILSYRKQSTILSDLVHLCLYETCNPLPPLQGRAKMLIDRFRIAGEKDAGMRSRGRESLEEICVRLWTLQLILHCSIGSFLLQPLMCSHHTVNTRLIHVLEAWDVTLFLSIVQLLHFRGFGFFGWNCPLIDMLFCWVDVKWWKVQKSWCL